MYGPKSYRLIAVYALFASCMIITPAVFVSCKKGFDAPASEIENAKAKQEFNVVAAQKWFYGVFKKFSAFLQPVSNNNFFKNSKLATSVFSSGGQRHYPYWDKGVIYKTKGGVVEVAEFPVFSLIKSALVLSKDSDQEKKKAAKAALPRIVFVRRSNADITPLLVTIVPSPAYAAGKG